MADTNGQPSKKRRILKVLAMLFLLVLLIGAGFFVGIYLRIFDVDKINESMKLYDMPVIGQFFVKRQGGETETEQAQTAEADKAQADKDKAKEPDKDKAKQKPEESKPVVLTKAEIEKQKKEQQAAEKKRVTKLARLYNEMKPKDAAAIMDALNDDITIAILQRMDESQCAKILTAFEPEKSARLTRVIYSGARSRMSSPGDAENAEPNLPIEPAEQ
ncbi:MAG: magnesium transporter MgtE [Schwartzia sp.]|nr:magnesium transporter MgtE [Schwartzia sp. (in: firmicutes)]